MFKKYYCVKQHDITDCGAACLATISKQYGFRTSITKIRCETRLEENGSNLSGGKRQRLAFARAILKKSDILILDKATSNLNSITERAIDNTIEEYSKEIYHYS